MHENKLEKILLWTLRIGLGLTLFSVVIYNGAFFYPYIAPRAIYFQLLTEILFAVSIILVVFFPRNLPGWNRIIGAIVLFFLVSAISTFTSVDPIKSLMGTVERSFGFFHILHFGFLFFVVIVVLKSLKEWMIFLGISIAISLYVSLHFLFSLFVYLANPAAAAVFPPSLMGNPTFMGAYLLLNLFFALFIFTKINNRNLRILLAIVIAIQAATIFASHVRGAFLGLAAGTIFLLIYYAWKASQWRMAIVGLIALLIASYTLLYLDRNSDFIRNNYVLSRITSFSDETTKARFVMWKMAIEGFKERPIFGWGRENYSIVFNKEYDPAFASAGVGEGWEDRAHDVIFDELTNGGAVELAAYIILMIVMAWATISKYPVLFALLTAYSVQNLFGVDTLNSYLPLFLFFALVYFLSTEQRKEVKSFNPWMKYGLAAAAILIFLGGTFYMTLPAAMANIKMVSAGSAMLSNDFKTFEIQYGEAKKLSKQFPSIRLELLGLLSTYFFQYGSRLVEMNAYTPYAEKLLDDMSDLNFRVPYEQRWSLLLGQLFQQTALVARDTKFLDKSNEIWKELLKDSPKRQIFLYAAINSQKVSSYLQQQQAGSSTKAAK